MSTLNLTNSSTIIDITSQCLPEFTSDTSSFNVTNQITDLKHVSLSSFEIIFIAACSSFLTLIFAGLFNFLKLNIKQQESNWRPPHKPNFDELIKNTKHSYIKHKKDQGTDANLLDSASFPPQNAYYDVVSAAYKVFIDAIHGTERDGWIFQGVKRGVRKYKKYIQSSPFSLFRGEKILNYPQNVLIHAITNKRIRLLVGDGQMKDCYPLEIIDENCKIQYEEYKSPAPFIGAREFVYIDIIHRLSDGTIVSFGRSVSHHKKPISNRFTRAELKIGGWALLPIPDEPNKTKVVYLVRCDLGGSMPAWIVNQITSDIPMTVERLDVSLQRIGAEQFNKAIMDVLLYGPKTNDMIENGVEQVDDSKQELFHYPSATESQKQRFGAILQQYGDLFSSKDYLDLIPMDKEWIKRKPILINGTHKEHEELLDSFAVPDKPFKYKQDIEEAFRLFNTWRKWENGKEWKEKAQKEDLKIYNHSVPNEAVDIIKGEGIIPFPVPIVCGVLLNPHHRKRWDLKLDEVHRVCKSSENTSIIYISVKTPTVFITYRDMVAITWLYCFEDGSMLLGSRSIKHPKYPPKKTRVRATINLDFWHIRPCYSHNLSHSKVTHYAHMRLGGSLPNWIVNEASVDIPSGIIKVRNYIKLIANDIHKPGMLNIPPFPFLKSMGIDIGWMDLEPHNTLFEDEKEKQSMEEKEEKQKEEEEMEKMRMNNMNKSQSLPMIPSVTPSKSPAMNYRPRKISENGSIHSSSSQLRRIKTPNQNLIMNTASIHSSLSQKHIIHRPPITAAPITATAITPTNVVNKAILLTRQEWENGGKLKLREIKIENAAFESKTHDDDKEDAYEQVEYKYTLSNCLSVRDAASYMTLANCAVSELLQQTDPSSKEYWVPSEAKTPRGIFVYKFIHSQERYYHYMGKAILHHEPKFIFDAITDPSFRFEYDKLLDEMQIIDKLDNHTYIARYLHTNKQCIIKQKRETVVVVRHRTVCVNDKYVAAGMSIEHKEYPTEIGRKTLLLISSAESDNKHENEHNNDSETISQQLTGKAPSKSIYSGMLRTNVKSSGWVIERNVKKPSDSIVSYITNVNFGGSVPSALLKSIAKKQPLAIYYLGKALKQRAKKLKQRRRQLRQQLLQTHQQYHA